MTRSTITPSTGRTLLIISPDYASHLYPLATLGTAWKAAGHRVVVATGEATEPIVESFGFERIHLQLGRGSNPGVIRVREQPAGEDESLRGFFEATRRGMVATLAYQASERSTDLMWQPVETARRVIEVVESVGADAILVDHLAFGARLGLTAGDVPHADVLVGHPSALPLSSPALGREVYGFPPEWPAAFDPDAAELAELRALCERVSQSFTSQWNAALAELAPHHAPSRDAFAEHGDLLLLNYPRELVDADRSAALPDHEFLGSAVRSEPRDDEVEQWFAVSDAPFVYVSFGSFLSVRSDVLGRVCAAISASGMRAAVALGSADRTALGDLPAGWLVRETLPQVTLLARAAAAVTHGGNNSVTEAVTAGVPLVVLPFSTDQFAGAAALERCGRGVALSPNEATVDELAAAIRQALELPRGPLTALADELAAHPGGQRAFAAVARWASAQ